MHQRKINRLCWQVSQKKQTNFVEIIEYLLSARFCHNPLTNKRLAPKNTNLEEDVEYLFPVKIRSAVQEGNAKMSRQIGGFWYDDEYLRSQS